MTHPLGEDVLIELGKLTWAAIELEDRTDSLCSFIHYANPREDRRPISQKIKDARSDMRSWSQNGDIATVDQWLRKAAAALDSRNALLHATPLVVLNEHQQAVGLALGEMPRAGRTYNERSMSVDSIRVVRSELESAGADWTTVVYLADQNHPRDS